MSAEAVEVTVSLGGILLVAIYHVYQPSVCRTATSVYLVFAVKCTPPSIPWKYEGRTVCPSLRTMHTHTKDQLEYGGGVFHLITGSLRGALGLAILFCVITRRALNDWFSFLASIKYMNPVYFDMLSPHHHCILENDSTFGSIAYWSMTIDEYRLRRSWKILNILNLTILS